MSEFFKQQDCNVIGSEWIEGKLCNSISVGTHAISLDKANRLLRECAQVVYAYMDPTSRPGGMWINEGTHYADSTHRALLICVEPIERDSAESLLDELITDWDRYVNRGGLTNAEVSNRDRLMDRAKALRGGK